MLAHYRGKRPGHVAPISREYLLYLRSALRVAVLAPITTANRPNASLGLPQFSNDANLRPPTPCAAGLAASKVDTCALVVTSTPNLSNQAAPTQCLTTVAAFGGVHDPPVYVHVSTQTEFDNLMRIPCPSHLLDIQEALVLQVVYAKCPPDIVDMHAIDLFVANVLETVDHMLEYSINPDDLFEAQEYIIDLVA